DCLDGCFNASRHGCAQREHFSFTFKSVRFAPHQHYARGYGAHRFRQIDCIHRIKPVWVHSGPASFDPSLKSGSITYKTPGSPPRLIESTKITRSHSSQRAEAKSNPRIPKSLTQTLAETPQSESLRTTSIPKASSPKKIFPMPPTSIFMSRPP